MTKKVKNEWCVCGDFKDGEYFIQDVYNMAEEDPEEFDGWEVIYDEEGLIEDYEQSKCVHLDFRVLEYEDGTIEVR